MKKRLYLITNDIFQFDFDQLTNKLINDIIQSLGLSSFVLTVNEKVFDKLLHFFLIRQFCHNDLAVSKTLRYLKGARNRLEFIFIEIKRAVG